MAYQKKGMVTNMVVDVLIAVISISAVAIVAIRGVNSMRTGKNTSCGCGCSSCSSGCHCKEEKK